MLQRNNLKILAKINDFYLLIGLMVLGLLIRLPSLRLGLWMDEAATYYDALPDTFAEVIKVSSNSEINPPGFYLMMHQWMNWFGAEEVIFKIPALIFGLLLIPCVYILGRIAHSSKAGLIAATITTFALETVYYSQEARAYTLAATLTCVIVILYCKSLTSRFYPWYLTGFVFSSTVLIYSHYTGLLLVGSLAVLTFYLWWSRLTNVSLLSFAIAFGAIFLLYLPWLPTFFRHLDVGLPWYIIEPWWRRPLVFLRNLRYSLPLPEGNTLRVLWDLLKTVLPWLILVGLGLEIKKMLTLLLSHSQSKAKSVNVYIATLVISFALPTAIAAAMSYQRRYIFPFVPIAWVLYSIWIIVLFQYVAKRWPGKRSRLARQTAVVFLLFLLIVPNVRTAISLGSSDKSGVRGFARDFEGQSPQDTLFVVSDTVAPTFGYYFRQYEAPFYGFARWENPEIFQPEGYAELWSSPTLISDIEKQLEEELTKGYQKLVFVQHNLGNVGQMQFGRSEQFSDRLKEKYNLLEEKKYGGRREGITVSIFSLSKYPEDNRELKD